MADELVLTHFTEPITDLATDPQLDPAELKRRLQAPADEVRQAHNALAAVVSGITEATYPDTVTEAMLAPGIREKIDAKASQSDLEAVKASLSAAEAAISLKTACTVGFYTGDGEAEREIPLGFAPKAVLVLRNGIGIGDGSATYGGLAVSGCAAKLGSVEAVRLTESGFAVRHSGSIQLNIKSYSYSYLAFS